MLNFFCKHILHLFDPPVLKIDFFIIDYFMVKSVLFCFRCQMSFESSVSFEYFLCVKDLIWPMYRSLIVFKNHAYLVLYCRLCCLCWWLPYIQYICSSTYSVMDMLPCSCTVTVVCTNDLCLVLPNNARVVVCGYSTNVIHTTVTDLNCVPIKNFV